MRKEYKSTQPGYKIIITYPTDRERNFIVRGYPVDKNYDRVDNSKIVKRNVKYIEELETKKAFVKNIVDDQLEKLLRNKTNQKEKRENLIETELSKTFNEVLETICDYLPWQESYSENELTYSRRNIIPWIQRNIKDDSDFTAVEKIDLQKELAEKIKSHGNFSGCYDDALTGAAKHLYAFDQIYKLLMSFNPNLKNWSFAVGNRKTPIKHEQIKMIPFKVHKEFRRLVVADIELKPEYARGAALMDNDLRTGEASACFRECMEDMGDYIVAWVLWQEYKGQKVDRLKSPGSYRPVILDEWGTMVVRKCNALIDDKEGIPIPDSKLSAYVRNLLYKSGVDDDFFQIAFNDSLKHIEHDSEGKPILADVAAHVLRRHRASIQCNICNYSSAERDIYTGHKSKVSKYGYDNPKWTETHREIAIKNSLYDLNPEVSNNPKHKPIKLFNGDKGEIRPFPIYKFVNSGNTPRALKIDISTEEMGESISIISSRDVMVDLKTRSKGNKGKRINENLIGVIKNEEDNK